MKVCYIAPKCDTTKHKDVKVYSNLWYMLIPTLNTEAIAYLILIGILAATYYTMDLRDQYKQKKIKEQEDFIKTYERNNKLKKIQEELNGPSPVINVNPTKLF